jgi:hypothetical protein
VPVHKTPYLQRFVNTEPAKALSDWIYSVTERILLERLRITGACCPNLLIKGSINIEPDSEEGERDSAKLCSTTVSVVTLKRAVKSQLPIAEGR